MAKKKAPQHGGARKGAGRPVNPEGPAITIVASVPEGLVAALNVMALREGWSRSKAVTEAIRCMVKHKKC